MLVAAIFLTACGGPSMPPAGSQFEKWHDEAMSPPDAPYGVWNMARKDGTKASFEEQAQALESIGYLAGSQAAPTDTGVRLYNKDKAQPGLNFYVSGHAPAAFLMDMQGKVLHEWRYELKDVFPDYPVRKDSPKTGYWRRAHLLPDGSVLAIFEGIGIIKVDKDSKLIWAKQNGAHHDLDVLDEGDIWVLTRKTSEVPDIKSKYPTLEDFATLLDKDGNEKQSISLLEAARKSGEIGKDIWTHMQPDGDVMHSNSIQLIKAPVTLKASPEAGGKDLVLAQGDLLVSMLYANTLAVLEPGSGKFMWALRGGWKRQHHARVDGAGVMTLFDNRSTADHSAVSEIDPSTGKVNWEYRGNDKHPFYSYSCGSYYEQPNGNILITESDGGRSFEITREGEKVWEFYNPNRAGEKEEYIATLFDLVRVETGYLKGMT